MIVNDDLDLQNASQSRYRGFAIICTIIACVGVLMFMASLWKQSVGLGILGLLIAGPFALGKKIFESLEAPTSLSRAHVEGAKTLVLSAPQDHDGIPIGHARMPENMEPLHTLIEGATGTGKTQLLKQMVDYIRKRGDGLVVVDTGYDLHKTFGQRDDIILSPFDASSPGWMPHNEVRIPSDWNALAETLIPAGEGSAKEWNAMARAMFSSVCRGYQRTIKDAGEKFDSAELFQLLTAAPVGAVAPFLEGSAAASLADNEKGLTNVRMSFFDALGFWQDLKPGNFSVRNWVANPDRQSIFIPHTKRTLPASRTLIATWLDQIITEACDQGENRDNRVWIIIDELSSLGRIHALESAVTELRKTGFRVVCGIQNYEQVEQRYTRTGAVTISNNLSNKVILRANNEVAAERASKLIGDARHRITTRGSSGQSTSTNVQETVERVVLPSQILSLPDLHAYVRFAGAEQTLATQIPIFGKGFL